MMLNLPTGDPDVSCSSRIVAALVTVGAGLVAPPAAHADTSPVQRSVNALVS